MEKRQGCRVRDVMTAPPVTVQPDTSLGQAMSVMVLLGFHSLPVVDELDQLLGIITDRDLRLFADSPFLEMTSELRVATLEEHEVSEVMQRQVLTISPDDSILEAAKLMRHNNIGGLPVIRSGQLVVGMITRSDLLDCLIQMLEE